MDPSDLDLRHPLNPRDNENRKDNRYINFPESREWVERRKKEKDPRKTQERKKKGGKRSKQNRLGRVNQGVARSIPLQPLRS